MFNSTTGKVIKDNGLSLSTDGTFAANLDTLVPSQKAVKTYVGSTANILQFSTIATLKAHGIGTGATPAGPALPVHGSRFHPVPGQGGVAVPLPTVGGAPPAPRNYHLPVTGQ